MNLDIVALQTQHLPAAAALFCDRYQALRGRAPALPQRYESPGELLPRLEKMLNGLPGAAAFSRGNLVGYMTAFLLPGFIGKRSAYSPEWANAAELYASRQIYGQMYASLSAGWLQNGCTQHVFSLLANDTASLQVLHWLGFGMVAVDGIRGLAVIDAPAARLEIRQAGEADLAQVRQLMRLLEQHLIAAPIFWQHVLDDPAAWLKDRRNAYFLALQDGTVVAGMGIGPSGGDTVLIVQDEATAAIVSAYTREDARRGGAARLLLARCLGWAKEQGYTCCSVDYESANLSASGFWGRWFIPVGFSLLRRIDERLYPEEKK